MHLKSGYTHSANASARSHKRIYMPLETHLHAVENASTRIFNDSYIRF